MTFKLPTFLGITLVFGLVFVVLLLTYLINPNLQVKSLPKFINVIEIALIITIATVIISFSIAAIIEIDFNSTSALFYSIILPCVISLNLPLFTIITYILSKTEHFETL